MDFVIRIIVSLVPVALLFTLNYLDSFQLVRPRNIATALLIGIIVAI
jgi:hypothetical protein